MIGGAPFTDGDDTAIWADMQAEIDALADKGVIDADTAQALRDEARAALLQRFGPAYEKLIAWVQSAIFTPTRFSCISLPDPFFLRGAGPA